MPPDVAQIATGREDTEFGVPCLLGYCAAGALALSLFACTGFTARNQDVAAGELPHALVTYASAAADAQFIAPTALQAAPAVDAPPLPYSYAGSWTEGERRIVMLKDGERFVVIRQTGPLDTRYSVQAIERDRILLKYLPLSITVPLDFEAPGPATESRSISSSAAPVQQPKTDLVDN